MKTRIMILTVDNARIRTVAEHIHEEMKVCFKEDKVKTYISKDVASIETPFHYITICKKRGFGDKGHRANLVVFDECLPTKEEYVDIYEVTVSIGGYCIKMEDFRTLFYVPSSLSQEDIDIISKGCCLEKYEIMANSQTYKSKQYKLKKEIENK